MEALEQEAVQELRQKLSKAREAVSQLEDEFEELTGKPSSAVRTRRIRRPSITDEALQPQILAAMIKHGKDGLNAKQLAEKLNQDPLRIRGFISANAKVLKRVGNGPGTKFHLP